MPDRAPEILEAGAATFRARNAAYGNDYHRFGELMQAMFPGGIEPQDEAGWSRLGVFVMCLGKLGRYAAQFERGGHRDSAHDLMVYAAMLQELTDDNG